MVRGRRELEAILSADEVFKIKKTGQGKCGWEKLLSCFSSVEKLDWPLESKGRAFLFYKARGTPGLHSLGNEWSPTQKKCLVKIGFWLASVSENF